MTLARSRSAWTHPLSLLALALFATGCATMARQAMANPVVEVKDVVLKAKEGGES